MNSPRHATVSPVVSKPRQFRVFENPLSSTPLAKNGVALTRRFHISYINPETGVSDSFSRIAPALPVFENAFASLARGTLVSTKNGPVAVEDLRPGMMLQTLDNGLQPLLWIGAMTIVPHLPNYAETVSSLVRVTADSLGLNRPMPDLMLAPQARLLHRPGRDNPPVLSPAQNHCDGESIIHITPPTPVTVYQIAFSGHQVIFANGLEIESYLPDQRTEISISREMLSLFLDLFPHVRTLDDFGKQPVYQRLACNNPKPAMSA